MLNLIKVKVGSKLYNQLRDLAHVLELFCYTYSLWFYCDAYQYTLDSKLIGMPLVSIILSLVFGGLWEWCQSFFLKSYFDWSDVFRSALGGILGCGFYLSFPHIGFIASWLSLSFVGLVILSIYRGLVLIQKRNA